MMASEPEERPSLPAWGSRLGGSSTRLQAPVGGTEDTGGNETSRLVGACLVPGAWCLVHASQPRTLRTPRLKASKLPPTNLRTAATHVH